MARKKLVAKTRLKLEDEERLKRKRTTGKKRKQFHRADGLRTIQRLDAGGKWGRTKRFVGPLPVDRDREPVDPEEQYRRCGICKVQGVDGYATYQAVIPGKTAWVNLCSKHFHAYGCRLGPERGQKLVINQKWAEYFLTDEEKEVLKAALRHKARERAELEDLQKKARRRRKKERKRRR